MHHMAFVTDRTVAQRFSGQPFEEIAIIGLVFVFDDGGNGDAQQCTTQRQFGQSTLVGKETVVTDSLKSAGQNMEQETADEFVSFKRHRFELIMMTIVFPTECDLPVIHIQKPVIGNGDAMRIATKVGQDLFGTAEGLFGVHDPLDVSQWGHVLRKSVGAGKML